MLQDSVNMSGYPLSDQLHNRVSVVQDKWAILKEGALFARRLTPPSRFEIIEDPFKNDCDCFEI